MQLPPAFVHIAHHLPFVLAPPAAVFAFEVGVLLLFDVRTPLWLHYLAFVVSWPTAVTLAVVYRDIMDARRAERLGAVLPPVVAGSLPGGLSTVKTMDVAFNEGYQSEAFYAWAEEYGSIFNLRVLFQNYYYTTEPEHIKAMLTTQFDDFEKGFGFRKQMETLLGQGIFNADGELWKFHRAMTRPFLSKERISDFDIFDRHANDAIAQIKTRIKEGYPIDFQDVIARFTLDSTGEFLFGSNLCSLSIGLPYPERSPAFPNSPVHLNATTHPANSFVQAFGEAERIAATRAVYGPEWPLSEWIRDECAPHMRIVDAYIKPILAEAVAKKQAEGGAETSAKEAHSMLEHLVNYTSDQKILKDEILNILIAGRDSTACALTFVVYMLCEHPDILERLRQEILTKVGSTRRPTPEDVKDMKYLRAVINETLRLYSPVPTNFREARRATLLPPTTPGGKPYYVPRGIGIMYSVFLMHRRTDLWGPDALVFDPDRFLDERLHKYLTPNPFIFLPFNAGPRICLGQQFTYNEISFMLIRLLQNFSSLSLARDAQPPESIPPASWKGGKNGKGTEKVWMKAHLTAYVRGGLWVRAEESRLVETM